MFFFKIFLGGSTILPFSAHIYVYFNTLYICDCHSIQFTCHVHRSLGGRESCVSGRRRESNPPACTTAGCETDSPDHSRSNVSLWSKTRPIASTHREVSAGIFRQSLRRLVENARRFHNHPLVPSRMAKWPVRAGVKCTQQTHVVSQASMMITS